TLALEQSDQFRYAGQMMVVMLSDEESQVQDAHVLLETGMRRRALNECLVEAVQPLDERQPRRPEGEQDVFDGTRVVICLVGFSGRKVRGSQSLAPGGEVIEPVHSQGLEVQQMTGVFLNRPVIAISPGQGF